MVLFNVYILKMGKLLKPLWPYHWVVRKNGVFCKAMAPPKSRLGQNWRLCNNSELNSHCTAEASGLLGRPPHLAHESTANISNGAPESSFLSKATWIRVTHARFLVFSACSHSENSACMTWPPWDQEPRWCTPLHCPGGRCTRLPTSPRPALVPLC